ncbi:MULTISPECIES: helix-turn-helix domain-containing protein [unclassified Neglectibacter]|uniref:helix-turn-helix domain-containing protein n=1 Tax=unclassified Neglectibacter TaxID=2632164 RepID=UPI001411DA55|nr:MULTISPECIES: helix-turn-helix domain-containing protein [unclassified Neglectibacter]
MNYKGNQHLKWEDRLSLERMLKIKTPKPKIAEALGVCLKTVYNEIARGMCEQLTSELEPVSRYCADVTERKYQEHLRAKGLDIKLGKDFAFAEYIEEQIIEKNGPPARLWHKLRLTE